jgi:hypothetical protein
MKPSVIVWQGTPKVRPMAGGHAGAPGISNVIVAVHFGPAGQ